MDTELTILARDLVRFQKAIINLGVISAFIVIMPISDILKCNAQKIKRINWCIGNFKFPNPEDMGPSRVHEHGRSIGKSAGRGDFLILQHT